MEWGLIGLGGLSCLVMAWQDLRHRWIRLEPLLLLFFAGLAWQGSDFLAVGWTHLLINLVMVGVLLGGTALYLRLRGQGFLDKSLGRGDVFFFLAITTWFPPSAFMLFLTSGMVFALLWVVLSSLVLSGDQGHKVPLAGLLGLWWCLSLLVWLPVF